MSLSGSEKLGDSVLGCHFGNKAEHTPIKKRRFLFRSPSPPLRIPSSCSEETERLPKSQHASGQGFLMSPISNCQSAASASAVDLGQIVASDQTVDGKKSVKGNELIGDEALSGISILAALACSNNLEDIEDGSGAESSEREGPGEILMKDEAKEDLVGSVKLSAEGNGSFISPEGADTLGMDSYSPNGFPLENISERTSLPNNSVAGSDGLSNKKDQGTIRTHESCARGNRLHWDLNTLMDEWESPFECHHLSSAPNVADCQPDCVDDGSHSDEKENLEGNDRYGSARNVKFSTQTCETSSCQHLVCVDSSLDYSVAPKADRFTCTSVSKENCNAASTGFDFVKIGHDRVADIRTCGTVSSIYQVEKQNASVFSVVFSDKATSEIDNNQNKHGGDANQNSGLCDDGNALKDMSGLETGHSLRNEPLDDFKENTGFELDEGRFSHSHTNVEVSTSVPPFLGSQPVVEARNKVQHSKASSDHDNADSDMLMHVDDEKLPANTSLGKSVLPPCTLSSHDMRRSGSNDLVSNSDNVILKGHLNDGCVFDVSQGDPHFDKENELELDYDSQYEDGELRDSDIFTWEEYDGEDGETERLDYGSNDSDYNNWGSEKAQASNVQFSPGRSSRKTSRPDLRVQMPEKVDSNNKESGSGTKGGIRHNENNDRRDKLKESSETAELKVKMSGGDPMPESRKCSRDAKIWLRGESILKSSSARNPKSGLRAEDRETTADGSRAHRRYLSSFVERTASCSVLRRGRLPMQGSCPKDAEYSNPRSERECCTPNPFLRGRYSMQSHAKGRGGYRWADSLEGYRGSKYHHSPTYRGATGFHRSRPEDIAFDGTNTKERGASHNFHRPLRSRLPADREEAFRMRLGFRPTRERSPDRCLTPGRGMSVKYGAQMDGAPRRRFYGSANDCIETSLYYSHSSLGRRRRSFSPFGKKEIFHARRSNSKSPSRSRTRSPISLKSPGGRSGDGFAGSLGFKNRSRSNCRADARMPRVRSPHHKSGFVTDHVASFVSLPRNHGSPPPNSRWSGYKRRSSVLDRRSPGRIGPRDNRFDLLDPLLKPKSNEYSKSVYPRRFSEFNGLGRGRPQYEHEGNDDDKHEYRYGFIHPARRHDMDRSVKQFCDDDEDGCNMAHVSCNMDATDFQMRESDKADSMRSESRMCDLPKRSREERGPAIIDCGDGRYNANSKTFGTQEGDEDEASRRGPS
ncbi:unnamed protein product [Ilex paraguariensis]|uniref:Uncharacterized protein n=1 Tax=Ilex paraguariensis TaxID=185542 RepID=A0ABC8UEA3_9AQUA